MAYKIINEDSLTAIGNAIREKNGTTELLTPNGMATAISALSIGSSEDSPTDADLIYTGDCSYLFQGAGRWNWLFKKYGNRIKFDNPSNVNYMFKNSTIEHLPDINLGKTVDVPDDYYFYKPTEGVFYNADCKSIGTLSSSEPLLGLKKLFTGCYYLRECPKFADNFDFSYIQNGYDSFGRTMPSEMSGMFNYCVSLRSIPSELLRKLYNKLTISQSGWIYSNFTGLYAIDEVIGLPLPHDASFGDYTENLFGSYQEGNSFGSPTFTLFCRAKDIVFDTQEDGTPYTINMANQAMQLNRNLGYVDANRKSDILNYNSGITADKEVFDQESYNRLKNDPDWFSTSIDYSRYNHDSAVRTINSLPDTSAFLTSNGGTNTITFEGQSGASTDGGAINTLTEEEIAVATSKGWTIAFQ